MHWLGAAASPWRQGRNPRRSCVGLHPGAAFPAINRPVSPLTPSSAFAWRVCKRARTGVQQDLKPTRKLSVFALC